MSNFIMRPSINQWGFIDSDEFENCIVGPRGEGKGLIYGTNVLTPSGFKKVEDIKVGDFFVSIDGKPTRVIWVYPQLPKQIWELEFSDGTSTVCTDDHLWAVETGWDREGGAEADKRYRPGMGKTSRKASRKFGRKRRSRKIVTTHDIVESIHSGKWKSGGRWSIPLTAPIQIDRQDVPLNPYILGVLLGDGHLAISGSVSFASSDNEIVRAVENNVPYGMSVSQDRRKYCYRIAGKPNVLHKILLRLNVLGCRSWEKFIPRVYLWNDVETRLSVLQGLLDTDGTILKHSNSVSFSTTSLQLAKDVIFLIQSLGGVAIQRERHTNYTYNGEKKAGRLSYHISVRLPNGIQPFRLSRKAGIVCDKGERNRPKRYITNFNDVGKAESICFKVDHPSGLFLIHDFIVTHNTSSGIMAMTYCSMRIDKKYWPLPWVIVRDTWTNIERSVLKSFLNPSNPNSFEYAIRPFIQPKNGNTELILMGGRDEVTRRPLPDLWRANLIGVDSLGDLNKFQSFQGYGLWLEEPAPAAEEDIGSGISEDVWGLGISSLRHPIMSKEASEYLELVIIPKNYILTPSEKQEAINLGVFHIDDLGKAHVRNRRAQITMNYPDEDHWTWQRFHELGIGKLFRIPKGENKHVDDAYRRNMAEALKNRPDLLARLVEGRPTQVQIGEKVTPEYDSEFHRSKMILNPIPGVPVIRMWDGWRDASCIFTQLTPRGQFRSLFTLKGENTGMKQFITAQVRPYIANGKLKDVKLWRDMGDASIAYGDQSDSSFSAASIISLELESSPGERAKFEVGSVEGQHWKKGFNSRREVIKEILNRRECGEPMFMVSKEDTLMHRALNGGWSYKKTPTGEVLRDEPMENFYSHVGAALTHGLAKLYKFREKSDAKKAKPKVNIGKTYAIPGLYKQESMWR